MIIKEVTQVGNPIIRNRSKQVTNFKDKEVLKLVKDLTDSMRHHGLVGMAAPQIGVNLRIFVSEIKKTKFRKPKDLDGLRVFINPKILNFSIKKASGYEGCGSVADSGLFGSVTRPEKVIVKAFDSKGNIFELKAKGLLARIIQHEIDHLDGKVFLDILKDTKSLKSRSEYLKK